MSLLYLSPELLLMIGNSVEAEKDLNSLCQTSKKSYDLLNPYLYRTNTNSPKKSSALIWAAIKWSEATARMSLQQCGDVQWIDDEGRNLVILAMGSWNETENLHVLAVIPVNIAMRSAGRPLARRP